MRIHPAGPETFPHRCNPKDGILSAVTEMHPPWNAAGSPNPPFDG